MATFLLVRHGEAEGNLDHRFIGQSDAPLSPVGRRQAAAVSARLARMPIDRIISSDLCRAVDTVLPAANELGLTIDQDPRFREIDNGRWKGLLATEIAERWPELWARYTSGEDVPRPGGETWADVRHRVVNALADIAADSPDNSLVVVSAHGGPTLALASWACGLRPKGNLYQVPLMPPWNASITIIRAPNPHLIAFNDVGHLPLELQHSPHLGFLRS
ncbi:phosphoserine phosphatase 1 [bacterium BMS3Bbin01]|nr:phosphoserine phosphatase 1 [bacterium BMS3Bbin01]